jgi:hypothetical protein
MNVINKVGIISCSGEEIPAGTISRLATRRVLELFRPQSTVTLCLPLFLAGEEQERRFARQHQTITVDGCDKLCAKHGTEKYSGRVASSLVVTEILGDRLSGCKRSIRNSAKADEQAVWIVAEKIAAEVDSLIASPSQSETNGEINNTSCGCSCGSPPQEGTLIIGGKSVAINGLPLIFSHLFDKGIKSEDDYADKILETVRIYHPIEPQEEKLYRDALGAAYCEYLQLRKHTEH